MCARSCNSLAIPSHGLICLQEVLICNSINYLPTQIKLPSQYIPSEKRCSLKLIKMNLSVNSSFPKLAGGSDRKPMYYFEIMTFHNLSCTWAYWRAVILVILPTASILFWRKKIFLAQFSCVNNVVPRYLLWN